SSRDVPHARSFAASDDEIQVRWNDEEPETSSCQIAARVRKQLLLALARRACGNRRQCGLRHVFSSEFGTESENTPSPTQLASCLRATLVDLHQAEFAACDPLVRSIGTRSSPELPSWSIVHCSPKPSIAILGLSSYMRRRYRNGCATKRPSSRWPPCRSAPTRACFSHSSLA